MVGAGAWQSVGVVESPAVWALAAVVAIRQIGTLYLGSRAPVGLGSYRSRAAVAVIVTLRRLKLFVCQLGRSLWGGRASLQAPPS